MCQFTCLHLLISAQCKGQLLHFAHNCKYIFVKNNGTVEPINTLKSLLFYLVTSRFGLWQETSLSVKPQHTSHPIPASSLFRFLCVCAFLMSRLHKCCNIRFPSCLFSILFPLRSEVSLPQNTSEYRNIYTFSTFPFFNMNRSHLNYRWEDFCCMFSNFDCRCKRFYCISNTNLVKD